MLRKRTTGWPICLQIYVFGFLKLHCLLNSTWADGNLEEAAWQLGNMVERRNPNQPNPGLRADGPPCSRFSLRQYVK